MGRSGLLNWKFILVVVLIGAGAGLFLMFGPPKLLAKSETPDFCASCHVMEAEFEAWFHEGAHRRIKCVDCHLPHNNLPTHYLWKSIDGLWDMAVFYSGRVPETIRASEHARSVLQGNCLRCHETTVEMIDNKRQCWDCHRRLNHMKSGLIETR